MRGYGTYWAAFSGRMLMPWSVRTTRRHARIAVKDAYGWDDFLLDIEVADGTVVFRKIRVVPLESER